MKLWTSECEIHQKDTNVLLQNAGPRVLNYSELVLIGVASSLAVGTSVLIGELIKCVTGPSVVVSIILAGATALFGGLCSAEFGVQFLKIDSPYPYSYCWGRSIEAFIFGWALILQHVAGTASVAKGVISFTDALTDNKISDLLNNTTTTSFSEVFPYFDYLSLAIILLATIIISFGFKDSIILKKFLTTCSVVLMITIIIAGALKADVKNWENNENVEEFERKDGFAPFGGLGVVKGAAIALYGFLGFDTCSFTGNEIRKRKKNLPLAILATIFFTLVTFSGIGAILTLMVPYTELNSFAAVSFAFQHVEWIALKWVAIVATFFAFLTSFLGVVFPLPRIIQTMANDGLLFHWLGNNHQKFKTPVFAVLTGGLLTAVGAGIFTFKILVNLAIIVSLFIYTVLAFNVILLRYFPKFEDNEKEFWKSLVCNNSNVSLKAVLQNYFNFKKNQPANLTKAIIMGNLVLFCICSIGLGVIFNVFYEFLVSCAAEAVVPASILLCIMFCNIISMCCQPKSQEVAPFKVPLFPFIPCLSIFLNIFLMLTFDSITWILFSCWMVVGVLPYFLWHFWRFKRGGLGKTSLYEINRTNAVKLNESIWKIKSDKKSFYEGAVNPVFSYDLDDDPIDEKNNVDAEVAKETTLQLKQDEIIQRAESEVEMKADNLKRELQLNFIPENAVDNLEDESEKVQWECVAEIHTEEEFSPESIALEIVDNTYNFLSEVSDEMQKSESLQLLETSDELPDLQNNTPIETLENELPIKTDVNSNINDNDNSKNTVLQDHQKEVMSKKEADSFLKSPPPNSFFDKNLDEEKLVYLIVETFYEAHQSEMISQQNTTTTANNDTKTGKPILDEQNKVKDFKEKLNQLLKNQINNATFFSNNSTLSKSVTVNNTDVSNETNKDASHNNIKTLNKSQIKNKLELLLSQKPQRPSLKSSFNINLKETETENKAEKTNEDSHNNNNNNINGSKKENSDMQPSSTLVNSIKEKILSLKNIESEPSDICC